jgi:WD40-like Beta Propeller Repeat
MRGRIITLLPLLFIVGCGAEGDLLVDYDGSVDLAMEKFSGWSEPVNVGPGVNSPFQERSPALSPDKLSLYFTSDRPGGFGGSDIYVSRRDCLACPFGPAVTLGPNINTTSNEGTAQVSKDGKLLLFARLMPNGFEDILVSEREHKNDDFGWGPPKGLCSELNDQAAHFLSPWLMKKPEKSGLNFYYSSRPTFAVPLRIFRATVYEHHDDASANFGTCDNMEPATELNQAASAPTNDDDPTIRKDGKEMFFWSGRPDDSGVSDARLWTATRARNDGPWSAPVPVRAPIDSPVAPEFFPTLSWDARTLVFGAGRLRGGSGVNDIWITERTPPDDDDY